MENSRRKFFRQGLAGALLLGSAGVVKAGLPDPDHSKGGEVNKPLAFGDGWLYIC